MSTYMALDKQSYDIIFQEGGGIARVDKGRFVVQQVSSKLKTELGEWLLDPSVGWVGLGDFEKNFDLFDIEDRAKSITLNTDGVLSVSHIGATYEGRYLKIDMVAQTIYGEIDLTIPWGIV